MRWAARANTKHSLLWGELQHAKSQSSERRAGQLLRFRITRSGTDNRSAVSINYSRPTIILDATGCGACRPPSLDHLQLARVHSTSVLSSSHCRCRNGASSSSERRWAASHLSTNALASARLQRGWVEMELYQLSAQLAVGSKRHSSSLFRVPIVTCNQLVDCQRRQLDTPSLRCRVAWRRSAVGSCD